jgi:hypothetical protein
MPSLSPIFSQAGSGAVVPFDDDAGADVGRAGEDAGGDGVGEDAGGDGAGDADPSAATDAEGAGGGSSASAGDATSHPRTKTITTRHGPARQSETCFIRLGSRLLPALSIASARRAATRHGENSHSARQMREERVLKGVRSRAKIARRLGSLGRKR